jgi:hypothetical protein
VHYNEQQIHAIKREHLPVLVLPHQPWSLLRELEGIQRCLDGSLM